MLPDTVPASHSDVVHPKSDRRVVEDTRVLDEHLFNPSPTAWLVIDRDNRAVPGVAVSSLQEGLELVGEGRVAAVVGRLRDGVGAVDVDVPGDFGTWITAEVSDWLKRQGCWVLVRPSGGAPGRAHVFFAHPEYRFSRADERDGIAAAIHGYLTGLAAELKLRSGDLDLRDAIRPISSPHRHGHTTVAAVPPAQALRSLRAVLPTQPAARPLSRRPKMSRPSRTGPNARVVIPLEFERWRRALRPQWRTYLLTGRIPADLRFQGKVDRSLVEAACTSDLVWAVGDPSTAWRIIREAHPHAMTKARSQGQTWWTKYVWNHAVETAQAWDAATPPVPGTKQSEPAPDVVSAVMAGRAALNQLQWSVSPRQRASLSLVGHALLDRAARTGTLRIPCPERDLVLDTGIADRKTIRSVLRLLDGHLGRLHRETFKESDRETSSFEFELNSATSSGVWEIPPPAYHPPPPAPGTWALLPRASHRLWRALLASSTDLALDKLLQLAGLTTTAESGPSPSQVTTARAALRALSTAGLARVTAKGTWEAAQRPHSAELEARVAARYVELHEQVESERLAYRTTAPAQWRAGREAAYKSMLARQKAWWGGKCSDERQVRAAQKRTEFHQLNLTDQRAKKERLAARRALAGVSVRDHHRAWLETISEDEYARRSHERRQWFATLSPAHKAMAVNEWARFRSAHGLTDVPDLQADELSLLGAGADERDAAFLAQQAHPLLRGLTHAG